MAVRSFAVRRAAIPGLASTLARGFIIIALRAQKAAGLLCWSPQGDHDKAPGERTRESGEPGGRPRTILICSLPRSKRPGCRG
jgi:hypothetical protein